MSPNKLTPLFVGLAFLCSLLTGTPIAAAEEREPKTFLSSLPGLSFPRGVAFDQANDTVLVANGGVSGQASEVVVFPAAGGSPVAVINGSEALQKTPQGGFTFEAIFGHPDVGVAVDAAGDVYVSDPGHMVVDEFAPVGPPAEHKYAYACQFSGPGRGCRVDPEVELPGVPNPTFGNLAGLGLDPSGDLFVADPEHAQIDEFSPTGGDLAQISTAGRPQVTGQPLGVAVDATGDLFVEEYRTYPPRVVELHDGGSGVETLVSAAASGMSFDFDSGALLLAERERVAEYDPVAGTLVPESAFPTSVPVELAGGIATRETPGAATGDVYIVDTAKATVDIYAIAPLLAPVVQSESVDAVTATSAQLKAVIEPSLRATHYRFQFGPDQSYGSGELPAAPGGLIPGTQSSALAAVQLDGLTPGATYHYRVVATNKGGTTYGPDQTFTTVAPAERGLPDGRVYEMVSPLDKNGGDIRGAEGEREIVQASADGERVMYLSIASFAGPASNILGNQYLATRTTGGWASQSVGPPAVSGGYSIGGPVDPYYAFSSDLSYGIFKDGLRVAGPPVLNPPIPGTNAPEGYDNFYVHDNNGGSYKALLTSTPPDVSNTEYEMFVEGVTPDLSHVVVGVSDSHHGSENLALDEWAGAGLEPVNVLPSGESAVSPVLGSASPYGSEQTHTISSDGSRVFWSIGGPEPGGLGSEPVYVREDNGTPQARTAKLPPGEFVDASSSGSLVLLSTGEVYSVEEERELANVTGGAGGFEGELGASEDLSSIYFVDTAVLAGVGANGFGQRPQAGEHNIYLYRRGQPSVFIATLAPGTGGRPGEGGPASPDVDDWIPSVARHTAHVTPDGGSALVQSRASLTGYDNRDAVTGLPDSEIFLYHADTGRLSCVSCNPSGERPIGSASVATGQIAELRTGVERAFYAPRMLSSDGSRVFFDSPEALVAQDTNGAQDVYEYEGGRAHLISSGTGAGSSFFDASESGDDVFFLTANQLVQGDTDELVDLYDARVDGGFPVAATGPACTGTGCQGVPATPPTFATPAGATFEGLGNFLASPAPVIKPKPKTPSTKCKKSFVKKKGKCVRQKSKRKAKKSSGDRRKSK